MRRDSAAPSRIALLADPDELDRHGLALLLARVGCAVLEARTGDEFLALEREAAAVAVLDVALADVSAYECCRVLRERDGEGLPVVLVSAHRCDMAVGPTAEGRSAMARGRPALPTAPSEQWDGSAGRPHPVRVGVGQHLVG